MSATEGEAKPTTSWRFGAIAISAGALVAVLIRGIYPNIINLDAISVALIVIALLPWMRSVIKSIELPGIGKIEMREIDKIAQDAQAAGMSREAEPAKAGPEDAFSDKSRQYSWSYAEESPGWTAPSPKQPPDPPQRPNEFSGQSISVPTDTSSFAKSRKLHVSDDQSSRAAVVLRSRVRAREKGASGLDAMRIQMADLRAAIEERLAELGQLNKITTWQGAAQMVSELRSEGAIDRMQSSALLSVLDVIDRALEGEEMTIPAATKAVDLAGDVLETLDVMIKAEIDAIEPDDPFD